MAANFVFEAELREGSDRPLFVRVSGTFRPGVKHVADMANHAIVAVKGDGVSIRINGASSDTSAVMMAAVSAVSVAVSALVQARRKQGTLQAIESEEGKFYIFGDDPSVRVDMPTRRDLLRAVLQAEDIAYAAVCNLLIDAEIEYEPGSPHEQYRIASYEAIRRLGVTLQDDPLEVKSEDVEIA